ncbi:hypothetical protein B296_00020727 [Ensete ventricosum]|uniref:Uncharacterized protein n=1 Tax=Ensete ventricosum TaxID=4639 RepID=A0A426YTN1_ENSVE|nr:hypothetical protein B296_00020727 [Ensete ventricosum]
MVRTVTHPRGHPISTSRAPTPAATIVQLSLEVEEVRAKTIIKEGVEASGKQSVVGRSHPRKKFKVSECHKPWHGGEGSKSCSSKGKEQVGTVDETQTPRPRCPRSVKELCQTFWALDAQALIDHMKVELKEANRCRALLETERENYCLDLADSQEQLKEVKSRAAYGGHRQVLEIGGFRDGPGMDRLGFIRVWLWVALEQFKARYPDLEIEEDPFVLLPEDKTVPMEAEQPFDNSLPLLEG